MSKIYEIGTGYTPIPAQMGAATEIVVEELTRSLIGLGYDAQIIDIKAKKRVDTSLPIREIWVPGVFTGTDVSLGIMHKLKRVAYSISLAVRLKEILNKAEDEIILHFHNQYNLYFFYKLVPQKLIKKAKIIYTVHSYIWHGEWDEIKDTVKKRYFQEEYCLKRADHIFVLNEISRNNIIDRLCVNKERVHLIDNGVNSDVYTAMDDQRRAELKKSVGLGDKIVYIQVGSVCDRKNQLMSLRLLAPLMKEDSGVMFMYAGGVISEEYQQAITVYAENNGLSDRVKYVGELTPGRELNEFYNLASGMVFPSKAEGFSLVIIEAMSAGVPVIVNESLDFKLKDACVRFSDESSFLDQVRPLSCETDEARENRRAKVLDMYSWDKVAADYMMIINKEQN